MGYYPVFVDLRGRDCLVVGGGTVACEKIAALLDAEANVTVVAPETVEQIAEWSEQGRVRWIRREWKPEDVQGQFLVIAATDDPALHREIYRLVNAQSRLVNAVDDPASCNFICPAVAQVGTVKVAVSTAGCSPALAQRLRDRIQEEILDEDTGKLAQYLGEKRSLVKARLAGYERRQAFWQRVLDSPIPALLSLGLIGEADALFEEMLTEAAEALALASGVTT
ncbi:Siroheme synthase [bacterium HR16]|mgnify:CR=1 FL=1|nr:Siroheme synthase [bacterium HR16]